MQTATGIGPEGFSWVVGSDESRVPLDQLDFYHKAGYWVTNKSYNLRPEILETWYYAYRATRDPKYRSFAWNAFQAISTYCKVGSGFSSLNDVTVATTATSNYQNMQESYFFAEVLK
jgi:mannosyl-oligosaccharide alpha-1,2-mannosidase